MVGRLILVWRARRWNVVRDLRSTGMCPGQRSGEVDTAAGKLHANGVRMSQWRGDRDSGGAETSNRDRKSVV